ncbi:MAG TPA: M17 family peptidase N-terminal domain-containing protein, partial [Rhodanobacteraceae bacterium]|nr:M17 family peptidase N-terminal domain-containing protein [Rhodanobacteraceae bacterium]
MTLEFSLGSGAADREDTPCAVVAVFEDGPSPAAAAIDAASGGAIAALGASKDFVGKIGTTLVLHGLAGVTAARVLLVGMGARKDFDARAFERACGAAGKALKRMPIGQASTWLPELDVPGRDADWRVRACALAIDHACFRYTATLKPRDPDAPKLAKLILVAGADANHGLDQARAIARGISFARELGCLPPNLCTPSHIAAQAKAIADGHADAVTLEVLE